MLRVWLGLPKPLGCGWVETLIGQPSVVFSSNAGTNAQLHTQTLEILEKVHLDTMVTNNRLFFALTNDKALGSLELFPFGATKIRGIVEFSLDLS